MTTTFGTAAAAAAMNLVTLVTPAPTIPQPMELPARAIQRLPSRSPWIPPSFTKAATTVANDKSYEEYFEDFLRATTPYEHIIGELREWSLLNANWDGEGAAKPASQSIKEAVSFVRLLGDNVPLPEPMLLASGHAALYWNEGGLYADIEFHGDGRVSYFIKKDGNRHKGVLAFDSKEMPAVFPALINS